MGRDRLRAVYQRVQPQDVAWLVVFVALGLAGPQRSDAEIELLISLAFFQIVEPRMAWFQTRWRTVLAVGLKLLLAYLLIGVTGGVTSSYYLILMVPVVAAATTMGALGTFLVTLIAGGSYLSFLAFIDWDRYVIPVTEMRELGVRVLLFGLLALLMHQLAEASRRQAKQYAAAAGELAKANRNLQVAEAAVRRSERLAALGQLTAGLAHELRNPLGTIRASAEVLTRQLDSNPEVAREMSGYIRDEVDRMNSLISRFLDFARPLQPKLEPADVNEILDRALAELQRTAQQQVSYVRNYSPDLPRILADAQLLERVFCNLIANATEASRPGGTVALKTRPATGGVDVTIIDRGVGIDKIHMENIFNPFFTTKPTGVGLGLAIVSKIVDLHRARITVESEPGQGTTFRLWLPSEVSA